MLDIEGDGEGRFRGHNLPNGQGIVHAGQAMGQMIVAASRTLPDKQVKSIHAVMARVARADQPNEIAVDVVHSGRSLASASVDIKQQGKVCSRALVLLWAGEPDVIKHSAPMPQVPSPEECVEYPFAQEIVPGELRAPEGARLNDPGQTQPAEFHLWYRSPDLPDDPALRRALLVPPTVMFLIGTVIRAHPDAGLAYAERRLDTGVVSHSMTFADVDAAGQWLLVVHEASAAGGGLASGRGHVFGEDGTVVASFTQESLVRPASDWNWREGRPR